MKSVQQGIVQHRLSHFGHLLMRMMSESNETKPMFFLKVTLSLFHQISGGQTDKQHCFIYTSWNQCWHTGWWCYCTFSICALFSIVSIYVIKFMLQIEGQDPEILPRTHLALLRVRYFVAVCTWGRVDWLVPGYMRADTKGIAGQCE